MKVLRGFAWTSTLATFLLIFTGGLVRVSGAGLGCPDWPKCFGRWIPPTSADQLPPDIDASLFNFTLAWIEYGNRLLGMIIGLLILTTMILAIKDARKFPRVLFPSIAATILVAYVGWQGGQVVASGLEPLLVATHLMLSLLIALLLLYMSLQLRFLRHPYVERRPHYPVKLKTWLTITFSLALVQTALGTQLRGAIKVIRELEPLGGHTQWTAALGPIATVHQLIGVATALLVMHNAVTLIKRAEQPSALVYQASLAAAGTALGMLLIGASMMLFGYLPILQVFHLWLTALLLGSLLIMHVSVRYNLLPSIASHMRTNK
jgi:heme a synthase